MKTVKISRREALLPKPVDETKLGFGKVFTDYMLRATYTPEAGWHNYEIVPYQSLLMDPSNVSLHYGQLIFEGLKAYKGTDGKVVMFRPRDNLLRLNRSAKRFCIPELDVEETLGAISQLVALEKDWIPTAPDSSLYIRPFVFASDNYLGVSPSTTYTFLTILSPVGSYYAGGIAPTKIYVEDEYVRAVRGGSGEAKCAGNYGASLIAQRKAQELGYNQVLWLDGVHRKYIEEVGTSNAFFYIGDEVVTPKLNGSILPGITRDSTIQLLKSWGITVAEKDISIDELVDAYNNGTLKEAFATGTAAVISPIGQLKYKDQLMIINDDKTGPLAARIFEGITGIQTGATPDSFGWVYHVD